MALRGAQAIDLLEPPMTGFSFKISIIIGCVLFTLMAWPCHALEVELVPDNRLTLHAQDVYLRQILQNLAGQGINIRIDPAIDFKVRASYEKKPVPQVLNAILGRYNHALIWRERPASDTAEYRLTEIQIYKPGHKERIEPLKDSNFNVGRDPKTGFLFVRHELLVKLDDKRHYNKFQSIVRSAGGKIVGQTQSGIYRVQLPKDVDEMAFLEKIRELTGISGAEPNYAYRAPRPFHATNSDIKLPEVHNKQPIDSQIPVAVFDSGLAPEYQNQAYILDSFNAIDTDAPIDDSLGHGTQMSMLASGAIDPIGVTDDQETVPVIAIRGFDDNGMTSNYALMRGVAHAMEKGARVLSLSWHSETESKFLEGVLTEAASKGLVVVAAAGNEPTGKTVYPAAYNNVLGVGALDPNGQKWKSSNFGDFVSFKAPGFANMPVGYNSDPGIYAGTSISTAYTANQIAAYLSDHPNAGKKEIQNFFPRHEK